MVTAPGSPSVLSNELASIEQHVDWITDALAHARRNGIVRMEARVDAQNRWVEHVNEVADQTSTRAQPPGTWAPTSPASPVSSCPTPEV
jgi:cation diffusion facilitator CzcD-associated flavoprotein CzcO